jgi:hypothetical protein
MAVKLIIFTELTIEIMLYHHDKEDFKRFAAQIIGFIGYMISLLAIHKIRNMHYKICKYHCYNCKDQQHCQQLSNPIHFRRLEML